MSDSLPSDPWARRIIVRGTTSFVELGGTELLYRPKADAPPLQRVSFDSIARIVTSRSGDSFDVVIIGGRARARPSIFSETSIRRDPRTSATDWQLFLLELTARIDDARRSES